MKPVDNVVGMIRSDSTDSEAESALANILSRLSTILNEENLQIEQGVAGDHQVFIVAKNQALREMMSIQRSIQALEQRPDTIERLKTVRKLVDRNHQLLKLQVSALNDVTAFLTQTAITEQGDGTYGRNHK